MNNVFNFGQVASGHTLAQTFTISNQNVAGTPPITVRRVASAPPFLSTTTCGAALGPGQSCTVTVTYTPANQVAVGAASPPAITDLGTLTIESDAASAPFVLNLAGQAGPVPVPAPVPAPSSAATLATYTLSQHSLTFASTQIGNSSAPQSVTLANTGTQALHLASSSPSDFTVANPCTTVLPAATCTFNVASTPQTSGTHIAALQLTSDSTLSLDFISLLSTATPAAVTLNPLSVDFGALLVGSNVTLPVQVSNTGTAPVSFTSVSASGDYAATGACSAPGATLAPNATCTLQVTFTPSTAGSRTGTLAVATSATTNPLTVVLTGIGNQSKLVVRPSALAFGNVAVGVSASMQLALTNSGTAPVNAISIAGTGDYIVSAPCSVTMLAPGSSCGVQVTFMPSNPGARSGTLTVTSSDPSSPANVPLTGSGVAAGGNFNLTSTPATAVTVSGTPASYTLALTPNGGFTGSVALTCTPLSTAPNATCSLLPSTVTLAGSAQNSTVTINTITSVAAVRPFRQLGIPPFAHATFALITPFFLILWRVRRSPRQLRLLLAPFLFLLPGLSGCGGSSAGSLSQNIRYTPPGTYQFQVTAGSTTGSPASQSVILTLTVSGR